MIWVFLVEIFHFHEQFAAGELNQSGGRFRYLYKMYILVHAWYTSSYCRIIHQL
jgi:hypothetical protein